MDPRTWLTGTHRRQWAGWGVCPTVRVARVPGGRVAPKDVGRASGALGSRPPQLGYPHASSEGRAGALVSPVLVGHQEALTGALGHAGGKLE